MILMFFAQKSDVDMYMYADIFMRIFIYMYIFIYMCLCVCVYLLCLLVVQVHGPLQLPCWRSVEDMGWTVTRPPDHEVERDQPAGLCG